jgi:hypothetical protein
MTEKTKFVKASKKDERENTLLKGIAQKNAFFLKNKGL